MNTEKIIEPDAEKPCHKLGWCPYGALVEEFPLHPEIDLKKAQERLEAGESYEEVMGKYSCNVFGHNCPVFYLQKDVEE